jgi:hypothetical protein
MEEEWASIIRTLINYWMDNDVWGPIVNFVAVIELAIQSAFVFMGEDGNGTTAPINAED